MIRDFIAIDFETANQQPSSVCSIDDLRYQIASIPFVAHNACFDEGCLKAAFKVYQMERFIL